MATHSSILAWRIPWIEEPGILQFMRSQGVRHDWATTNIHILSCLWISVVSVSKSKDINAHSVSLIEDCLTINLWVPFQIGKILQNLLENYLCNWMSTMSTPSNWPLKSSEGQEITRAIGMASTILQLDTCKSHDLGKTCDFSKLEFPYL